MEDINLNENTLYFCCKEVSSLYNLMSSFSTQLSGLGSLPGELTSGLLTECQNMIKMYTNKVEDLDNRIREVKDTAIRNFPSIEALFAFYDEGLINESGEIDLGVETVKITSFEMKSAENGTTYFVMQTQIGDHIYLSGDCMDGPNVLECYFPGIGGLNSDYSAVTKDIKKNGIPSNIIMAFARKYDNASFLNTVDEITKNANIDVSGVHVTTFSGSGATGFIALNEYLKEHSEMKNVSLVSCDGYYIAENIINGDNPYVIDEIINRKIPIAMVDPSMPYDRNGSDLNVLQMTEEFKKMGCNVIYIKENSKTIHDANFIGKVVQDGLGRYLSSSNSLLSNSGDYGFTTNVSTYNKDFNNLFSLDELPNSFISNGSTTSFSIPKNTSPGPQFEELPDYSSDLSPGDMARGGILQPMPDIPLFDQTDYKGVSYGASDIAQSGCGITCLAMLASYEKGKMISPAELAKIGNNVSENHAVDNVGRMLTAADALGMTYNEGKLADVLPALGKGKKVIALVNVKDGSSSHFVLLKGITDNGKIAINDPYGPWQDAKDNEGYELSFSEYGYIDKNELVLSNGIVWIFD